MDDFICPGMGCTASIERECLPCGPTSIDYRTEDMVAKAGQDFIGVRSGQVHFAAGATSATLTITTIPRQAAGQPRTFRVVLSVDGTVVDDAVGTITDG
jgi:Calx-beta domain